MNLKIFFISTFLLIVSGLFAQIGPPMPQRRAMFCREFELKDMKGVKMPRDYSMKYDTAALPPGFPAPPKNSKLCGCHVPRQETYYTSPLDAQNIINHYTNSKAKDYVFEDIYPGIDFGDIILPFRFGEIGAGHIIILGEKLGYKVIWEKYKKSCNCGVKK